MKRMDFKINININIGWATRTSTYVISRLWGGGTDVKTVTTKTLESRSPVEAVWPSRHPSS